jgi:ABC-2 type transport system permease protein
MNRSFAAMVAHETRYDGLSFLRNRQSQFFTLVLPVLFLVIFASVFSGGTVAVAGGRLTTSVYYVPGIMTLGIIAASFLNLVLAVTTSRESGIYKRRRATPVSASVIIAGRALTAVAAALGMAAVLLAIGWPAFGASIPGHTAPALVLSIVVGALAFCCLGFAVASLISSADAAQPVTQAMVLPLYFISGVFIPTTQLPGWLRNVAGFFPVRHLVQALLTAYNPHTSGAGFAWSDLGVVVLWGLLGLVIALRRFSWLPRAR